MAYSSQNPLSERVEIAAKNFPTKKVNALLQKPIRRKGILKRRFIANKAANIEAGLVQCRGIKHSISCSSCQKGNGPFVGCVTIPGQLDGSCANCHYHRLGSRCNFRRGKDILMVKLQCLIFTIDQRDIPKTRTQSRRHDVLVVIPPRRQLREKHSFSLCFSVLCSHIVTKYSNWAKRS